MSNFSGPNFCAVQQDRYFYKTGEPVTLAPIMYSNDKFYILLFDGSKEEIYEETDFLYRYEDGRKVSLDLHVMYFKNKHYVTDNTGKSIPVFLHNQLIRNLDTNKTSYFSDYIRFFAAPKPKNAEEFDISLTNESLSDENIDNVAKEKMNSNYIHNCNEISQILASCVSELIEDESRELHPQLSP